MADMHQTLSLHTSTVSLLPRHLEGIRDVISFSAGYTNKKIRELQTEIQNQNRVFDGRVSELVNMVSLAHRFIKNLVPSFH